MVSHKWPRILGRKWPVKRCMARRSLLEMMGVRLTLKRQLLIHGTGTSWNTVVSTNVRSCPAHGLLKQREEPIEVESWRHLE